MLNTVALRLTHFHMQVDVRNALPPVLWTICESLPAMAITRLFRNGNSQAMHIPSELADELAPEEPQERQAL